MHKESELYAKYAHSNATMQYHTIKLISHTIQYHQYLAEVGDLRLGVLRERVKDRQRLRLASC